MHVLHSQPTIEAVKEALDDGALPMLPLEAHLLAEQFGQLSARQQELARELNDAMSQTSETWHDNAPADAINHDSARNATSAEKVSHAIRHALVFEYPTSEEEVTLGSLIAVTIGGKTKKDLFLAGYTQEVKQHIKPTITPFTLKSPMGEAILGATADQEVTYAVGQRTLSLVINKIYLPGEAFPSGSVPDLQLAADES